MQDTQCTVHTFDCTIDHGQSIFEGRHFFHKIW